MKKILLGLLLLISSSVFAQLDTIDIGMDNFKERTAKMNATIKVVNDLDPSAVDTFLVLQNDTVYYFISDTTGQAALEGRYYLPTVEFLKDYVAANGGSEGGITEQQLSDTAQSVRDYTDQEIQNFSDTLNRLGHDTTVYVIDSLNSIRIDTLEKKNSSYITPELFGAVGDGTTDDYLALYNAINYAAINNKTLLIPADTFYVGTSFLFQSDTINKYNYLIEAQKGAVIDGSDVGLIFQFIGDTTSRYNLVSNITRGDSTFTSSYTNAEINDIFFVGNRSGTWDSDGGYPGELVKIKRVNGATLTIYGAFYDDYTIGSHYTQKQVSGVVEISGLEITGNYTDNNSRGLRISRYHDVKLDNIKIDKCIEYGIAIEETYTSSVLNSQITRSDRFGLGYGVVYSGGNNATAINNIMEWCRHGISIGGRFPLRNYKFMQNTISIDAPNNGAIDCHATSEFGIMAFNHCIGSGLLVRGRNVNVNNNTVILNKSGGDLNAGIRSFSTQNGRENEYLIFKDNIITATDGAGSALGILFDFRDISPFDSIKNMIIDGNYIHTTSGYPIDIGVNNNNVLTNVISNLEIKNNTLITDSAIAGIQITMSPYYDNILISGNKITSPLYTGITFFNDKNKSNRCAIKGNDIRANTDILVMDADSIQFQNLQVSDGNYFEALGVSSYVGLSATNVSLTGNYLTGFPLDKGIKINNVDYFNIRNNIWTNSSGIIPANTTDSLLINEFPDYFIFNEVMEASGTDGDSLRMTVFFDKQQNEDVVLLSDSYLTFELNNQMFSNGLRKSVNTVRLDPYSGLDGVNITRLDTIYVNNNSNQVDAPNITFESYSAISYSINIKMNGDIQNNISLNLISGKNVKAIKLENY